jgi:hypothetical protein
VVILLVLIIFANILFFWDALKKETLLGLGVKIPLPWSFLGKHLTPNGFLLACFVMLLALNGIGGLIYYLFNILGVTVFYAALTALDVFFLTKDENYKPKMPV